jgi:hypothetical protein
MRVKVVVYLKKRFLQNLKKILIYTQNLRYRLSFNLEINYVLTSIDFKCSTKNLKHSCLDGNTSIIRM